MRTVFDTPFLIQGSFAGPMKIRTKLTLLTFSAVAGTSLLILLATIFIIRHQHIQTRTIITDNIRRRVKEQLKNRVDAAVMLLESTQQSDKTTKEPEQLAMKRSWLLKRLADLRFDKGKGYYWVLDTSVSCPRLLMHPFYHEYENALLCKGPDSLPEFSAFLNSYRLALDRDSGFIEYSFSLPNNPENLSPKMSYIKIFEPWGVIIGSGMYLDDIDRAVSISQERTTVTIYRIGWAMLICVALILTFVAAVVFFFSHTLTRPIVTLQRHVTDFAKKPGQAEIPPVAPRNDEVGRLREAFAAMARVIQENLRAMNASNKRLHAQNAELNELNDRLIAKEKQVYASNRRLHLVAEHIQEVLFLLDNSDDSVQYVSPAVERVFGFTPEDIVNAWPRLEGIVSKNNRDSLRFLDREARYAGVIDEEFRAVRPDGQVRWVRLRSFPIHDESGGVIGAAGIFADVTVFKEMGERERLHREQLMHAEKMASLGILVSSIAHEINNPNNYLLLNAKIVERAWKETVPILDRHAATTPDFTLANLPYGDASERLPKLISGIRDGGERIRAIIDGLRTYVRKDHTNQLEPVNLN
ncbi:MAG: PAS domain S-box protein, partial [Chitinivibrionales bacterium]|nr:PAS domain S-box protein [Chitinivibrionales bacterium]MBD3358970.1 PAS domain S-box protein [Chitinivibrionales bacterium]